MTSSNETKITNPDTMPARRDDAHASTLSRRRVLKTGAIGLGAAALNGLVPGMPFAPSPLQAAAKPGEPEVGDNGLHIQPFFKESFLELADDLSESFEEGKNLAIIWEQRGCPYCRELHRVNFPHPAIRSYIDKHFTFIQLDLWGSRTVTDFNGKEMAEKALARAWSVNFTPTINFFPKQAALGKGMAGKAGEIARMPGYFKPFHFRAMLEFIAEDHYKKQGFQRYLQDKFAKLKASGQSADVWNEGAAK